MSQVLGEPSPELAAPQVKTYKRAQKQLERHSESESERLSDGARPSSHLEIAESSGSEYDALPTIPPAQPSAVAKELADLFNPYEEAPAPDSQAQAESLIVESSNDASESRAAGRRRLKKHGASDAEADSQLESQLQTSPSASQEQINALFSTEAPDDEAAAGTQEQAKENEEWFSDLELPDGAQPFSAAARRARQNGNGKAGKKQTAGSKHRRSHYQDPDAAEDDIHKTSFRIMREGEVPLPHRAKPQAPSPAEFYQTSKSFYSNISAPKSSVLVDLNERVRLTADPAASQMTGPSEGDSQATGRSVNGSDTAGGGRSLPHLYPEDLETVLVVLPPVAPLPQASADLDEQSAVSAASQRDSQKLQPSAGVESSLQLRVTPSVDLQASQKADNEAEPQREQPSEEEEEEHAEDENVEEEASSSSSALAERVDEEDERAVLAATEKQIRREEESGDEGEDFEEEVKEQILQRLEDRRARGSSLPELPENITAADEDLLGDQEKAASSEEEGEDLIERADDDDSEAEAQAEAEEQPDSDDERAVVADTLPIGGKDEKATKLHQRWRDAAESALEQHITDNVMARQREEEAARLSRMRRLTKRLLRQRAGASDSEGEYSEGGTRYDAPEPGENIDEQPTMTEEVFRLRVAEERRKRRRMQGKVAEIASLQEDPNAQEILSMISEKKTTAVSASIPIMAPPPPAAVAGGGVGSMPSTGTSAAPAMYSRQNTQSFLAQHSERKLEQLVATTAKRTASMAMSGRTFVFTANDSNAGDKGQERDDSGTPTPTLGSSSASLDADDSASRRLKRSNSASLLRNSALQQSNPTNPLSLSSSSSLLSALHQDSRLPG